MHSKVVETARSFSSQINTDIGVHEIFFQTIRI